MANIYGPELVTNGDFTGNATGWTLGTGWAYDTNNITATTAANDTNARQTGVSLVNGGTYEITYTISGYSAGGVQVRIFGTNMRGTATTRSANGTYTEEQTININTTVTTEVRVYAIGTTTATIDNVSVREIIARPGAIRRKFKRRVTRYYQDPLEYELDDPIGY